MIVKDDDIYCLDCVAGLSMLAAGSASLIICDPPYFNVKGEFDKAWGDDFGAYLSDVRRWAGACRRALAPNGTLIWYGGWRNIAYAQVELDKMFRLVNSCVIHKRNGIMANIAKPETQRSFLVNDERFLVYEAAAGEGGEPAYRYAAGIARTRAFAPIVDYLRGELRRSGLTVGDVNRRMNTHMGGHWFTDKSQWQMPSRVQYEELRRVLRGGRGGDLLARDYDELRGEYEARRKDGRGGDLPARDYEYVSLRRPFRMEGRQFDVFTIKSTAAADCVKWGHATPKDEALTETLIRSTTRPGDLVVAPFAGSGTECLVAKTLGRRFVGFDIDARYVESGRRRLRGAQMNLFT